ncbi:transposable element Tcb2 transposase [Trichonephila clavipes]|uniref:Transposable element Tcb2 transposase n=1 Tax=Trichonephila clavipes TaxID=2585209 RepID=A0A8X6UWN1_TRICX|nr:transposable element Tcb2 transposase [Trichonephila clavipes]
MLCGVGQVHHRASTSAHDRYLALCALRHRQTTVPQLARDHATMSGRRISRQTLYSRLTETGLYSQCRVFDESSHLDSDRVFPWKENGSRFHPSYETKIDRFGGKGSLLSGCIILCSYTPQYIFDTGTVNSQFYRDEIMEAYERLFWVLWTRTTFL